MGAEAGEAGKVLSSTDSQRGKHVQGLPPFSFKLITAFSADLHESRVMFTVTLLNTVIMSLAQPRHITVYHLLCTEPWVRLQLFPGGSGWQDGERITNGIRMLFRLVESTP